jgi:hypothetical protein
LCRFSPGTTGSPTLGEISNPARDCPDVVDNLPGAKDGFYWILLKHRIHKVQDHASDAEIYILNHANIF